MLYGWIFCSLTVEIDATHLTFFFGLGFLSQQIPLTEIRTARRVKVGKPLGIRVFPGIRRTVEGWQYYISRSDAVKIELKGGKRILLETDEPQELARQIARAR